MADMASPIFTTFPILTTERLILRRLSEDDQNEIFLLRSDEKINRYIDRPRPVNISDAVEFIRKISMGIDKKESLYWAICFKDNPLLIGTICLWNFSDDRQTAEIGYELQSNYQGQGIMYEAINCIIRFAFDKILLKRIDAFTQQGNSKSVRLLENCNFLLESEKIDEDNLLNRIYSLTK